MRSEVDIDIETLNNARYHPKSLVMSTARMVVVRAVIQGLEDKKIFEDYCNEQDPTKGGEE